MQFCEEFISFLCTVIHTMSVFMCGVCLQGVWCGNRDRGGPCVLHSPGGRVVRDGPGWWSLWEVCRDVPLNNGKNRQVGHITFIHIPPSFSHLSSWPAYSLAIFYFSTLFIPLFYPAFNPQPHPRVSHDVCFLFSFLKNLLLEGIAKTSSTVSTNACN